MALKLTLRFHPLHLLHLPNPVLPDPQYEPVRTLVTTTSLVGDVSAHGICFDGRAFWVTVDGDVRTNPGMLQIDIHEGGVARFVEYKSPIANNLNIHDIEYLGGERFCIVSQLGAAGASYGHIVGDDGDVLRYEFMGPFAGMRYHGAAFDGRNIYLTYAKSFISYIQVFDYHTGDNIIPDRPIVGAPGFNGPGCVYTGGKDLVIHGDTEQLLASSGVDVFYITNDRRTGAGDGASVNREPGPLDVDGTIVNSIAWTGKDIVTMEVEIV